MRNDVSDRWAKIITENNDLQNQIRNKIGKLRDQGDEELEPVGGDKPSAEAEGLQRFYELVEDIDDLITNLLYFADIETWKPLCKDDGPIAKVQKDRGTIEDTPIDEKRLRSKGKKKCTLANFTPQEIEKRCNAMNLMDFPSFVRILNTINQANAGKLGQAQ